MVSIKKEVILAYALDNAITHGGKVLEQSVMNALFFEGFNKQQIDGELASIKKVIAKVDSMDIAKQKKELEEYKRIIEKKDKNVNVEKGLFDNSERNQIIRIGMFPYGPIRLNNSRIPILANEYIKENGGRILFLYEDLIGNETHSIVPESYDLIKEGLNFLNIKISKFYYKSDRYKKYYSYAEDLIHQEKLYVCNCSFEGFKRIKDKGIDCPCRHLPSRIHLDRWKRMLDKNTARGEYVVRLKTNMQDSDKAFRDRVVFKISDKIHPRTKAKYRVYPSIEFSNVIDDYLMGINKVFEYSENIILNRTEDFIRDLFGWVHPKKVYFGNCSGKDSLEYTKQISKDVRNGLYAGWNDPRLMSIQSFRDRGISSRSIVNFILSLGTNRKEIILPMDNLYSENIKEIYKKSKKFFFVPEPVKIKISGNPSKSILIEDQTKEPVQIRRYSVMQEFYIPKSFYDGFSEKEYRLLHLFNFKVFQMNVATSKEFSFVNEENKDKIKKDLVPWVCAFQESIKIKIMLPNGKIIKGIAEQAIKEVKEGEIVEFELFGFAKLHKKKKETMEFWFSHA